MPIQKEEWQNLSDLPKDFCILHSERKFNKKEIELIKKGSKPASMDDKWFIYYEDNILYIHRSWSGYCIYKVHFEKLKNNFRINKILVNREKNQYLNNNKEIDSNILNMLLNMLLKS